MTKKSSLRLQEIKPCIGGVKWKEAIEGISVLEKCTKQYALNAAKNAKYLSNQQKADLCTAGNALAKKGSRFLPKDFYINSFFYY